MQSVDIEVLDRACEWLQLNHKIWLVTVTQTFGASPRPPGSLMLMRDDGILVGSVSGGCIEDDLVARRAEFAGTKPALERYGITAAQAQQFGLPCGGALEVLIEAQCALPQLQALRGHIAAGEVVARQVNLTTGAWQLSSAAATQMCTRDADYFISVHGPRWRMLVIGASEIARYLAEIAQTLDFQVSICDPREEYRHAWRVADVRFVDGMPDDAVLTFKPDAHTVIITVSHDPKLDDMALLTALAQPAFYVGAVGSQKTSAERRARLQLLDIPDDHIAKLHAPVGCAIGSRTPPEIALAILAELVAARNNIQISTRHTQARL
jgi:xanthine dehydrogenase accessory factor